MESKRHRFSLNLTLDVVVVVIEEVVGEIDEVFVRLSENV